MTTEATPAPRPEGATLNRLQVLRGLRLSMWEAALTTFFLVLTYSGPFITGFALALHATTRQVGLIAGIASLGALSQLVCPYLAARARSRRFLVLAFAIPGRMLWAVILLIPFMHLSDPQKVWLLIGLFAVSMFLIMFPTPAWITWMTDLVPEDNRGRFFGRRAMIGGFASVVGLLASGYYKDTFSHRHPFGSSGTAGPPAGASFSLIFGAAVVFAILSCVCLAIQPEPRGQPEIPVRLRELVQLPFRERNFRRLTFFIFFWAIAVNMPAPYFMVYMINPVHMVQKGGLLGLGLTYSQITLLAVIGTLGGLASLPAWGYLMDKFGNRPIMVICAAIWCFLPWPWVFASHDNAMWVLGGLNLASGVVANGYAVGQFNIVIRLTPVDRRQSYLAAVAGVAAIGAFIAPLIGAWLLEIFAGRHLHLLAYPLTALKDLFIVTSFSRIACSLFGLRVVEEPASQPAAYVLQQIAGADPVRTALYLRGARQASDPVKKAESIHKLGNIKANLAVEELAPALQDPSLTVRREAARALGRIRDPRAVEALGEALLNPALGISVQSARSLGAIGAPEGVSYLREALKERHHPTLVAVLRALGSIGANETAEDVSLILRQPREGRHPEIVEAACDSLSLIGGECGVPDLIDGLYDSDPRTRAAAARALAGIGTAAASPALAAALCAEDDERNIGVLADALSQIGSAEDIPWLQSALRQSASPVLRRQIAHALASLVAPASDAYPLMAGTSEARDLHLSKFVKNHFQAERADPTTPDPADHLTDALHNADFAAVVHWSLQTMSGPTNTPAGRMVRTMAESDYGPVQEEEALLCLLAASATHAPAPTEAEARPRLKETLYANSVLEQAILEGEDE